MSDSKVILGGLFVLGYYTTIWMLGFRAAPAENIALVKDAMLVLGPVVGMIFQSLFRSDRVDEQRARNTGVALSTIGDAINASPPATVPVATGKEDDPLHTVDDTKDV